MTKVIEQLLRESESAYLDFKRQQYAFVGTSDDEKSELLKDILAFANAWRRTTAYILIGVEEIKGERGLVHGINNHFDDASIQQFVNSKTQRPISFAVETVTVDGKKIDVISIPIQKRPIYLKRNYGKLKAGIVYQRQSTSTIEANPDEIAAMGSDAVPKNPEPILEVAFAQPIFDWVGHNKAKVLGHDLKISKKAVDVSLLKREYRGVFAPVMPNALENANRLINDMEQSGRLRETMEHLGFAIVNRGSVSARNVESRITIRKDMGLFVAKEDQVSPFRNPSLSELLGASSKATEKGLRFRDEKDTWRIEQTMERILPEHAAFFAESYYFGAATPGRWEINVSIYADNLSAPIRKCAFLEIEVRD